MWTLEIDEDIGVLGTQHGTDLKSHGVLGNHLNGHWLREKDGGIFN